MSTELDTIHTRIGTNEKSQLVFMQELYPRKTEIMIDTDGSIMMHRTNGDLSSVINIDSSNTITIEHQSGSYIKFLQNGDIIIKSANKLLLNP